MLIDKKKFIMSKYLTAYLSTKSVLKIVNKKSEKTKKKPLLQLMKWLY